MFITTVFIILFSYFLHITYVLFYVNTFEQMCLVVGLQAQIKAGTFTVQTCVLFTCLEEWPSDFVTCVGYLSYIEYGSCSKILLFANQTALFEKNMNASPYECGFTCVYGSLMSTRNIHTHTHTHTHPPHTHTHTHTCILKAMLIRDTEGYVPPLSPLLIPDRDEKYIE